MTRAPAPAEQAGRHIGAVMHRRRFITIAAAAGLSALAPGGTAGAGAPGLWRWRGTALGAETTILVALPDAAAARRLVGLAVAEIERLEAVFSLYRTDSALSRLNREGRLDVPSFDLVRLLAESRRIGALSGGAFDVTVQPLWRLHAAHFAAPGADPAGPPPDAIDKARRLVDYRGLDIGRRRVRLARPGMAVTLNGIAQGYITDRVAEILRDNGLENVLVDIGEARALGAHPAGRPWRVGIEHAGVPGRLPWRIDLADSALATSAGGASRFDAAGRHHHLFDPRTGSSANYRLGVSVAAKTATLADALSTALFAMPADAAKLLAAELGGIEVYATPAPRG